MSRSNDLGQSALMEVVIESRIEVSLLAKEQTKKRGTSSESNCRDLKDGASD